MMKLVDLVFVTVLALAAAPAWAQTGAQTETKPAGAAPAQVANSDLVTPVTPPPAVTAPAAGAPQGSGQGAGQGTGLLQNTDALLGIHRRKQ